jgi:hypothetical protein
MDQMGEWLLHLPVVWMGLVIFAGTYLIAATIFWSATRLNERVRVVDPGLLSPLGVVFGLLVVFTAAQVWGDLERGGNAVATEANALREVVLLGDGLPENEASDLRALVSRHIAKSATEEWPAMAQGHANLAMPSAALREALQEALTFPTVNDAQRTAQREIVSALLNVLEARRQRIVISQSTVNPIKWFGLLLTGLCVLIAITLVHLDNRRNCGIALALFATGMAVSLLLIASHSRPFTGEISVGPDLLWQIPVHDVRGYAP